jgi:hypothetical protein
MISKRYLQPARNPKLIYVPDIFVPPEQVLDTVDIYFLTSRQRRLSLRFLTWIVLKEQIQQDTHDSIEDARSALKLWQAFLKFEEDGVWDQKLEELYREGKKVVSGPSCLGQPGTFTDAYILRVYSPELQASASGCFSCANTGASASASITSSAAPCTVAGAHTLTATGPRHAADGRALRTSLPPFSEPSASNDGCHAAGAAPVHGARRPNTPGELATVQSRPAGSGRARKPAQAARAARDTPAVSSAAGAVAAARLVLPATSTRALRAATELEKSAVRCMRLLVLSVGCNVIAYVVSLYATTCCSAVKLLRGALPPITSLNTVPNVIS